MFAMAGSYLLVLSALVGGGQDADWKKVVVDQLQKGKLEYSLTVLRPVHETVLTRAVSNALEADGKRRLAQFLKDMGEAFEGKAPDRDTYFHETTDVVLFRPGLVSISTSNDSYMGGAHPYGYQILGNWATVGGKPRKLHLADLLVGGRRDQGKVSALVIAKLRKHPEADWVQSGEVPELKDDTRDSFEITKTGLKYIFAPYVMGSYASGEISVFLAWSELKGLVDPNGPLKPVLK